MHRTTSAIAWVLGWVIAAAIASAQTTRPAPPPAEAEGAAGTQPAPATTQSTTAPADLKALAKQLSDPNWQVRRSARESFVRMGDQAKPVLEALVRDARDEETRLQAGGALAQIEENRTLGPSYITLHLKDAHADEVFAEISKQCHAPLPTYPENLWGQGNFPAITIDVDRRPFWEVMPKLCQHFGVDFTQFQTGMRIMRTGMNRLAGITQVEGPFLVVANQLTYTRSRNLSTRGENSSFSMSVSVFPEPKITLMRGATSLNLIEAVDDHGNSLLPPLTARSVTSGFGAGAVQLYAPMVYPRKNPGTKIARFRASATFNIQTKSQQIQIADVMKVRDQHVSLKTMDVTLKEVTQKPEGYEMKLSVITSPLAPAEFRNIYDQVQNNLHLLDDRGQELPHAGISTTPLPEGAQIDLHFMSGVPGRTPDKMVWEVPIEFRPIVVPIQFNDIPLFEN